MSIRSLIHSAKIQILVLALSLLVCGSCAVNVPQEILEQEYQAAIADAKNAEPWKISKNLDAITAYNDSLIWDGTPGASRLRVVTWTSWDGYLQKIGTGPFATAKEIWITAAPDLIEWMRNHPFELVRSNRTVRLEQLLGLPPDNSHKWFVELWVSPTDLFRPSPDPEINDQEAEL